MASDPCLPMIPGSRSSGMPPPTPLQQPSYSGEESTLPSPGPSVELGVLSSSDRKKTVADGQGADIETPGEFSPAGAAFASATTDGSQAGVGQQAAALEADATAPDVHTPPPAKTPDCSLSAAATVLDSEQKDNARRDSLAAVAEAGGGRHEQAKQPVYEDETAKKLAAQIPLGLNRYVLASLFGLIVLLKGCTYWGWNGFQDMFYKNGAYLWECKPGVAGYGQHIRIDGVDYHDCAPRKNSINNLYTVTFCTHFISSAFSGWFLDAAGPKICMLTAILVEVAGWLFFAFSSEGFCAYYAGAVLLGIAADPAYLPLLSVSALFPGNESFAMSVLGSLRSISFAVPVILSRIYLAPSIQTDRLWVIIVCYVGIGLGFCFLVSLLLVPNKAFQPLSEEEKEHRRAVRAAQKAAKRQKGGAGGITATADGNSTGDVAAFMAAGNGAATGTQSSPGEEHNGGKYADEVNVQSSHRDGERSSEESTFFGCLRSREFLLILPCFLIALLRTEFYSKSNKEQLVVSTTGKDLYEMFSIVNILSFIPGPLMGKLADIFGIVAVLALLNTCGIFVYVFLMPDEIVCKGISLVFYFFYCSFVLSNLYCYVAINFPQKYFGKLTGFASLVGGVFSLTSLGWYKLSSETLFSWYPHNYLLVDGIMVLLGLINCFIIYGMYAAQKKKKALLRVPEASDEAAAALC